MSFDYCLQFDRRIRNYLVTLVNCLSTLNGLEVSVGGVVVLLLFVVCLVQPLTDHVCF